VSRFERCPTAEPFNLNRFVEAQNRAASFEQALAELHLGRKTSHWIWWVFPQLAGLATSSTSREYAIYSLEEARAYLAHPVLGARLREATGAVLAHADQSARQIFGPDDVKFHSSMTLFARASTEEPLFQLALERFFGADPDHKTDQLLGTDSSG